MYSLAHIHRFSDCFAVDSYADSSLSDETAHWNLEVHVLICSTVFGKNSELNT